MTIYLPLLNEGTDCWRPVEAELIGNDCYRILADKPADEDWPTAPGSIVRCKLHQFSDGSAGLVAIF